MKKTVSVSYFAILREERGLGSEQVSTEVATAGELYEELRGRHGFTLAAGRLRVAINDELEPWSSKLNDGDVLAFLPPIAGG
ncbi:MAG: MoaD/ThiS family protein [Opitutaceae bacterium]